MPRGRGKGGLKSPASLWEVELPPGVAAWGSLSAQKLAKTGGTAAQEEKQKLQPLLGLTMERSHCLYASVSIYFLCVCTHTEDRPVLGVSSLPSPRRLQESNSGHQVWWQEPLPTEPSSQPSLCLFDAVFWDRVSIHSSSWTQTWWVSILLPHEFWDYEQPSPNLVLFLCACVYTHTCLYVCVQMCLCACV